jgi:hypothetical protein
MRYSAPLIGVVFCSALAVAWACGPEQKAGLPLGAPCVPGDASSVCGGGFCLALDSATGVCSKGCKAKFDANPAQFAK